MSAPLFDPSLTPLRRMRADKIGADYFLHERAFEDILDRLAAINRSFKSALLFGHSGPDWADRLRATGLAQIAHVEPGSDAPLPAAPDLCISVGILDTLDALPDVLATIRHFMVPDGLFLGAVAGGQSFPALRRAMLAADQAQDGAAHPRTHPRVEASALAGLLAGAGFANPVVDVDRVRLSYRDLDTLVGDLRKMAGTNRLLQRPRTPILRTGLSAARRAFNDLATNGKTQELVEILHFAAWTPAAASHF